MGYVALHGALWAGVREPPSRGVRQCPSLNLNCILAQLFQVRLTWQKLLRLLALELQRAAGLGNGPILGARKQVPATQRRVTWRHKGQIALFLNFFSLLHILAV